MENYEDASLPHLPLVVLGLHSCEAVPERLLLRSPLCEYGKLCDLKQVLVIYFISSLM